MKLVTAVSALTLLSVGAANAAVATYDFEGATNGSVSVASFSGALTPLGITSSVITGASGTTGVQLNQLNNSGAPPNNANTTINYGLKSFAIGQNGTWTLLFGNNGTTDGVSSVSFAYDETEAVGFTAIVYAQDGVTVLSTQVIDPTGTASLQCQFASTCSTVNFTGLGTIGKLTITDRGNDNAFIDNLSVNTVAASGVPEPSTYFMIGSALAGLAAFRRRRA